MIVYLLGYNPGGFPDIPGAYPKPAGMIPRTHDVRPPEYPIGYPFADTDWRSMAEVDLDTFAREHAAGATVIDVREAPEYLSGHVPGAKFMPMSQLAARVREIDKSDKVYVICASGNRSGAMTHFLRNAGYEAYSVAGGTGGWVRAGRPVVHGRNERG